jgi:hypothetical protein
MLQVGSSNNILMVTPAGGNPTIFPNADQAIAYITQQTAQGNAVNIGAMQIPSSWLKTYHVTPAEIIRPCKNVAVSTQIISEMWAKCGHLVSDPSNPDQIQACALSMFRSGDPKAGLDYASHVMNYATAHPFSKVAAPAMARWEKYAKVPKLPAGQIAKTPATPTAVTTPLPADNSDTDTNNAADSANNNSNDQN